MNRNVPNFEKVTEVLLTKVCANRKVNPMKLTAEAMEVVQASVQSVIGHVLANAAELASKEKQTSIGIETFLGAVRLTFQSRPPPQQHVKPGKKKKEDKSERFAKVIDPFVAFSDLSMRGRLHKFANATRNAEMLKGPLMQNSPEMFKQQQSALNPIAISHK